MRDRSTGWLIDKPAELAEAIEDALETLSDPTEAACWAERCREWSASFNWESTARRILSVLESEDDRLKHGLDERRRRSDATTVVEFPRHLLTRQALLRLRRMDQVRVTGDTAELLLSGADERDAERVLDRLGLPVQFRERPGWLATMICSGGRSPNDFSNLCMRTRQVPRRR